MGVEREIFSGLRVFEVTFSLIYITRVGTDEKRLRKSAIEVFTRQPS